MKLEAVYYQVMHNLSSLRQMDPETGSVYSRAELREAFEAVQDPSNWKMPIDAAIPEHMQDVTREAVIFFAGCVPTFHGGQSEGAQERAPSALPSGRLLRGSGRIAHCQDQEEQ